MTRSELIQLLAEKQPDISFKEMEKIVKTVFEFMGEALGKGDRIEVRGFGSFSIRYRAPRMARNPKTGEKIEKTGKFTPYYRPGKELRERVNAMAAEFPLSESNPQYKDEDET